MTFKFDVNDFNDESLNSIIKSIDSSYKKPLCEVTLYDLLLHEKTNKALRHGVYMYFNGDNKCVYVGMCSSSHFAHRIGGHFGMSPKYGMNTFLKRAVEMLGLKDKEYDGYVEALPLLANYGLVIIDANTKGKSFISKLEKLFHIAYKPDLNFPKGFPSTYKPIDSKAEFSELLGLM